MKKMNDIILKCYNLLAIDKYISRTKVKELVRVAKMQCKEIKRLKAENERLKAENERLETKHSEMCIGMKRLKSEARKEFAESVKELLKKESSPMVYSYLADLIDNLLKEMEGEENV